MKLMRVHVYFNKFIERCVIKDKLNNHVFMLPDCINFNRRFPNFNKEKVNVYDLPEAIKIEELPLEEYLK